MQVIITGASGLIGSALTESLRGAGHEVRSVSRRHGDIVWDLDEGRLDPAPFEGADAVVHLAGESIGGRWTSAKKRRILESRVRSTTLLAETIATLGAPPPVVLSGSAIGYYGDTGGVTVDESSPPGDDFLADVTRQWEAAAAPIAERSRLAMLRTGIVLSPSGGALGPLRLATKLFVGGPLGSGEQIWSWITLTDEVRAIEHLLTADVHGPVNLTAPHPVSQKRLVRELARELGRPAVFPVPAFAVRALLGEMGEALILSSADVRPSVLDASGFSFEHDRIEAGVSAIA